MGNRRSPLNRSITFGCVVFIIVLCIFLSVVNQISYKHSMYEIYDEYLRDILTYTMGHIDGDDLEECILNVNESETYKETLLFMDELIDNITDIHYFYAIKPIEISGRKAIVSVLSAERYYDRYIDTEGNLYLGWISSDEYDEATIDQLAEIMNGDDIVFFEEETEWGLDYTGAVPIKNSKGEGIAVLAVDVDITYLRGLMVRHMVVNIFVVAATGGLFIALFLIWSHRNITGPIRALEKASTKFANISHSQRDLESMNFEIPKIKKNNEIKDLSNAIVKMTEDMKDYLRESIIAQQEAASLQELANKDSLTGVRNKTAYDNEMKRAEVKLEDGETEIGIAMVDLNYLKVINDTYGHEKGDIALKNLCRMICVIFDHSPVFRIGGDEFVIILRGHDYHHYDILADSFNKEMNILGANESLEPWEKVSAAIGAAFFDPSLDKNLDDLFKRADHNMYERKKAMKAARM